MPRREYVLDPHETDEVIAFERAAPLDSLDGAHLYLLGNSKPNADRMLQEVGRLLRSRHGVSETTLLEKPSAGRTVEEHHLTRMMAEAHAIITGIGD